MIKKLSMVPVVTLFLSVSFISGTAHAEYFKLFKAGRPIPHYDAIVASLKYGDEVGFSDGTSFKVLRNLSAETAGHPRQGTTAVLAIESGRILRIPKRCQDASECAKNKAYLQSFVKGAALLQQKGVPIPRVLIEQSRLPEFVVVEQLEIIELLPNLLRELNPHDGSRPIDNRLEEFKSFATNLWAFSQIGDFHAAQVALTPKGYVLIDWTEDHILAEHGEPRTTPLNRLMIDYPEAQLVLSRINQVLLDLRSQKNCSTSLEGEPAIKRPGSGSSNPTLKLSWD